MAYGIDYGDQGNSEDGELVNLVPPIRAVLRVPQGPVEPLGKTRRGTSATVDPESTPFIEAAWDRDAEAFGHVLDYAIKEVGRRIAFTIRTSRETPAKNMWRRNRIRVQRTIHT